MKNNRLIITLIALFLLGFGLNAQTTPTEAVSYTHLDVYKRQVHGFKVIVVRSVCYPMFKTVATFGRTPFIPCHFSAVVVSIYVGFVRGVQVPLSDISGVVSLIFKYITPAPGVLWEFHSVRGCGRITVTGYLAGDGVHTGHQHSSRRR